MTYHDILPLLLCAAVSLSACADMDFNTSADAEDALQLSASSTPFVAATRADADEIDYRIYVVHQPERAWTADTNFIAADGFKPKASGILGTSATTGGYVTGDSLPTRFHQKTLSFYGLTLSNNQDPAEVADKVKFSEDGTPCYHFSYNSAPLPDIRVGYIQTDITGTTNGVVDLPFKHALAKLEIYISHAEYQYDDNGDAHTWNDQYTISQCEIQGPQGGTIDLNYLTTHSTWSTDLWTPDETTTTLSTLAGESKTFSTTLVPLTDEENGFLIFPCHSFHLIIKETNEGDPHDLTVEPGNSENFDFEPNHLYRIYLQYTQKGSFIVTVHPDYYDYITEEATTLSIGNPTLFNGVVWADRNIGATSSTYNNIEEWEEMRGYFYQMGRNIPYKTYPLLQYAADDPNAADANHTCHEFVRADGSKYYWVQSSGDVDDSQYNLEPHLKDKGRYLYPYIPGLWETVPAEWGYASFTLRKGTNSYYNYLSNLTYYQMDTTTVSTGISDRVLMKSKDNSNMFIYLTVPDTIASGVNLTPWYMKRFLAVANRNSYWKETSTRLWENNVSPCPPGWRIPTNTEWKGIVPVSELTGDITYYRNIKNYSKDNQASSRHTYEGDYCWYETSDNDPISDSKSIYYGNMPQGKTGAQTKECGDIYIIKYHGTSSAYGLHIWVDKSLTATKNTTQPQLDDRPDYDEKSVEARSVLYIDRYTFSQSPAKATFNQDNPPTIDENGMLYTYDSNNTADPNRQKTYWYKVETMTFPICGVGHYDFCSLIWSGTEAQYASSSGNFVRMKVGGSNSGRFVYLDTQQARTAIHTIRPVRDETAISW